jgi:DNA-binding CsgD family transcriptional regulator
VKTAKVLSLSPKTFSTHKANVMRKLGLRSTADLIRWGLERNIA